MKIAVMGAGAMGSVYAGLLTEGGHDVWAVDVWRQHVDAIRERGLRVEGASGDRVVRLNATTDPLEPGICDLVVVATKAAQVGDAAQAAAPLIGADTLVLTIQNGLGAGERICQSLDASRVLLGVAGGFGASMRGPGHVHHNGMQLIRLGEMNGGITARLERVAEAWRAGGFNVKAFEDIEQLVWEKFVCNVTFSGPCTVLEATIGEVMGNPDAWPIAIACAEEAFAAGKAKGVNFSFDDATAYVSAFGEKMPHARPSMLLDYLAGRRSEIDAINGMVPVVARAVGTTAPVNETVVALVKAKEALAEARRQDAS
ncbi:MAG: ketopantoate reductase family protein [Gammaproteobacteria bacterium]